MGLITRVIFVLRIYTCFRDKQRQAHERMPLKRLSSAMTVIYFYGLYQITTILVKLTLYGVQEILYPLWVCGIYSAFYCPGLEYNGIMINGLGGER